ncbi:MAG: methyl-accepting chemotaxis protein [Planococcaceae bacterium]|nr:methyl-accepting chemotaxis protein [Planococcaceae bacterium]
MNKWDKIPLRKKYMVALGSSFILFTTVIIVLVFQVLANLQWSQKLEKTANQLAETDLLLLELNRQYISMSLYAGDPMDEHIESYQQSKTNIETVKSQIENSIHEINWSSFDKTLEAMYITFDQRLPESISEKDNVSKRRQLMSLHKNTMGLVEDLTTYRENQNSIRTEALNKMQVQKTWTLLIVIVASILAIILSSSLLIITNRQIKSQLNRVATKANGISQGNLIHEDLKIHASDEIGQVSNAMNNMKHQLTEMILLIQDTAFHLSDNSSALNEFSADTKKGSKTVEQSMKQALLNSKSQFESAQTIQLFFQSFSNQMKSYRRKSQDLLAQSSQAEEHAVDSSVSMTSTVNQMMKLKDLLNQAENERSKLQQRTNEIVSIASQVKQISKQTNLLALNAGIEAARSGEHGKGFAVVAEEVRSLAAQVSDAATHIHELSSEITSQGQKMSDVFAAGLSASDTSSETINETASKLTLITSFIGTTKMQFEELEIMMQTLDTEQESTYTSIGNLTNAIQQNMALIDETNIYLTNHTDDIDNLSKRIEDVGTQSETLLNSTSQFELVKV